ncbi:MAG: cyclic nucleotide-binding domain-containing protein [bacterium]|nr:cyclic nucleotide-binding domain-containing protein [bacterium]
MSRPSLERILRVRRQEQPLLLLMVATIALFQFCQIVNENFSETVFLKRYGVRHLPGTFFFNSLAFLVIIGALNRVVDRTARARLISQLLLVFAGALLALRLLLLSGASLAYPVIYIAVKQMKYVFFIVFWTLASDVYPTRKARRLFPLIGGGGVLGVIAGSVLSGRIAALTGTDNLPLFGAAGMLSSCGLVALGRRQVGRLSPVRLSLPRREGTAAFWTFLRRELGRFRRSSLLGYLMVLALLPGIVQPLFEYIFNYLADRAYPSEESLLGFFGLFKGSFNAVILACQVFVAGGLFRRYGIVNLLFSYPIGYLFTFGGLALSFRLPAAVIGKGGLEAIDAALYKPGSQMLYNIIPPELRGRVSALVQGAVRRIGELGGSGLLWLLRLFVQPHALTLVGPCVAVAWLLVTRLLKRSYASILYRSLSEKHVDFGELEERDLRSLMTGEARAALAGRLATGDGATAVLAARLLAQSGARGWAGTVCAQLARHDPATQVELLRVVAGGPPDEAIPAALAAADRLRGTARAELAAIVRRAAPGRGVALFRAGLGSADPRLVAESLIGLRAAGERIDVEWALARLEAADAEEARAAVYFLGEAGDPSHLERLLLLAASPEADLRAECALALGALGLDVASERWRAFLEDPHPAVRRRALEGLAALRRTEAVAPAIAALRDEDAAVRAAARALIEAHGEAAVPIITAAIPAAGILQRAALMEILERGGMKEQTLLGLIDRQVADGYRALARMRAADGFPPGRAREALFLLLANRLNEVTDDIFRALGLLLKGSRVQFFLESYHDREEAVREQALEALENVLTPALARRLLPLLEDLPLELKLEAGARYYGVGGADLCAMLHEMLDSENDADALCGLMCIEEARRRGEPALARPLSERARRVPERSCQKGGQAVEELMERVLTLKGVPIFSLLQFKELLAIASIAQPERYGDGDEIVRQGERGSTMYIITAGRVRIVSRAGGDEVPLATLGPSDYFGEMALFDDSPRSASAVAAGEVGVLAIEKREFRDMLREYPAVSIMMCEEFCRRLRRTIEKVSV